MHIFVWAPSNDARDLDQVHVESALNRIQKYKIVVSFAEPLVNQGNPVPTLTKEQKITAFSLFNQSSLYDVLMPVYGGHGSILLLDNLKKISINKKKIICGKSDTTVFLNALWKTKNIQTVSGLDFSKICNKTLPEEEFEKIIHLLQGNNITYHRPPYYTDGYWYISDRSVYKHEGWYSMNTEQDFFSGTVVGGNLDSLINLMGTKFFPSIVNNILVIEALANEPTTRFIRNMQHLKWHTDFFKIKLMVIGKFGFESPMNNFSILRNIIRNELQILDIPILYNVDLSHTEPSFPFIIGGNMEINLREEYLSIRW